MIDKTAIIHPSAQIAEDAIIGPYVVIGEGVKIGSGTRVISNAHIEHAEIGKIVQFHHLQLSVQNHKIWATKVKTQKL